MKKIIYLLPILLIQCAPATVLTGCATSDMYYDIPEVPTTPDGRGATQIA